LGAFLSSGACARILPVRFQPALPVDRLVLHDSPGAEAIEMDVLIVGAGPAGLACAIELAHWRSGPAAGDGQT
jgi:NADPH-dependent 2,4-dienoyl-CoA reductase/sulfur reductase-like enzyme